MSSGNDTKYLPVPHFRRDIAWFTRGMEAFRTSVTAALESGMPQEDLKHAMFDQIGFAKELVAAYELAAEGKPPFANDNSIASWDGKKSFGKLMSVFGGAFDGHVAYHQRTPDTERNSTFVAGQLWNGAMMMFGPTPMLSLFIKWRMMMEMAEKQLAGVDVDRLNVPLILPRISTYQQLAQRIGKVLEQKKPDFDPVKNPLSVEVKVHKSELKVTMTDVASEKTEGSGSQTVYFSPLQLQPYTTKLPSQIGQLQREMTRGLLGGVGLQPSDIVVGGRANLPTVVESFRFEGGAILTNTKISEACERAQRAAKKVEMSAVSVKRGKK